MELACEGHRFWDIVRCGIAEQQIENHPMADGFVPDFVSGQHEFYPLPEGEIIRSNGVLEQNPGY
ncbi:MAG: RagB/SusD family nutrient uptake outer membrane protein [Bacteroidales bacterium]|nr:RagB/SusD family nutrient uptake outer membrane protein [Bacteroidales bacterium]